MEALKLKAQPQCSCSASKSDPNRVIAKDVKSCTYCCYLRGVTLIVRVGGIPWLQNRRNFQTKVVQSKGIGCLLLYIVVWLRAIIYGMDGSKNKGNILGLVHCCNKEGDRAQVPQLPIDSYIHLTSMKYHIQCIL